LGIILYTQGESNIKGKGKEILQITDLLAVLLRRSALMACGAKTIKEKDKETLLLA
jgi:hypothetical protein